MKKRKRHFHSDSSEKLSRPVTGSPSASPGRFQVYIHDWGPDITPDNHPGFLLNQVYQSKAYKIQMRLELLVVNYQVFKRNYKELEKLITAVQSPESFYRLWVQGKEREMQTVLQELTRLLHNFTASAKTLIDHTRALIFSWYHDHEFLTEYQDEINRRFKGNELAVFIEDLRNYSLHYRLPLANAVFEYHQASHGQEPIMSQTIFFKKDALLQWSSWKKGRDFLSKCDDKIPILAIVQQYQEMVSDFHRWMHGRLSEIHSDELQWLNDMFIKIQELNATLEVPMPFRDEEE